MGVQRCGTFCSAPVATVLPDVGDGEGKGEGDGVPAEPLPLLPTAAAVLQACRHRSHEAPEAVVTPRGSAHHRPWGLLSGFAQPL